MTEPDVIEVEPVEVDTLPAVREATSPTLFQTADPVEVVEKATRAAVALKSVVDSRGLTVQIQGRKHVRVEGWTLLGSMLGVFAVTTHTELTKDAQGNDAYLASVEARRPNPMSPHGYDIVGSATALCSRGENLWSYEPKGRGDRRLEARDDHALLSMAQTRATSKALASALRFVMDLAGYAGTPAEEMPRDAQPERAPEPRKDELRARLAELLKELADLEPRQEWPTWCVEFCQKHFGKDSSADLLKPELASLVAELERERVRLQAEGGPV